MPCGPFVSRCCVQMSRIVSLASWLTCVLSQSAHMVRSSSSCWGVNCYGALKL